MTKRVVLASVLAATFALGSVALAAPDQKPATAAPAKGKAAPSHKKAPDAKKDGKSQAKPDPSKK